MVCDNIVSIFFFLWIKLLCSIQTFDTMFCYQGLSGGHEASGHVDRGHDPWPRGRHRAAAAARRDQTAAAAAAVAAQNAQTARAQGNYLHTHLYLYSVTVTFVSYFSNARRQLLLPSFWHGKITGQQGYVLNLCRLLFLASSCHLEYKPTLNQSYGAEAYLIRIFKKKMTKY